jgi:hypothetical protein
MHNHTAASHRETKTVYILQRNGYTAMTRFPKLGSEPSSIPDAMVTAISHDPVARSSFRKMGLALK